MNNTTGNTSGIDDVGAVFATCAFSKRYIIASNIIILVIAVTTYFGNTLILVSLSKFSKHFKGTLYTFIRHLAVADMLLAIGLTLRLVAEISSSLQSNKYFCLLRVFFVSVSLICSNKVLLLISMDRFCAIVFPMKHLLKSSKKRRRRVVLFMTWFGAILIGCVPTAFEIDLTNSVTSFDCLHALVIPDLMSYIATILITLQFLVNVVLCVIIVIRLKMNTMSERKYRSSIKKCGFMLKVYVMFALCWTPYILANIVKLTTNSPEKLAKIKCKLEFILIPGFLNSGVNWIIYGLANAKFRKAFKKIILCDFKTDITTNSYRVQYQNSRST